MRTIYSFAKESDVKGFYITFEKHGDKLLISSFVDLRKAWKD